MHRFMANLADVTRERVDFDAFATVLSLMCDRLGMDAAWAGYRDDDEIVIAASSGDAAWFGSERGARVGWEDAMRSGMRDPRGRAQMQCWLGEEGEPDDPSVFTGSYLAHLAQLDDWALPVGFVCFASRRSLPRPEDAILAEAATTGTLFAQIVASAAEADLERRRIHDRVADEIEGERISIVYQPVAETLTGRIAGAEALSRFSCGPPRPDVWFAEARSVGLGVELELAAVRAALAGLDGLPAHSYLAVNVSPEVYLHPSLRGLLAASDPSRIVLEITEHDAIDDYEALIETARNYRDLGCRLAVDDVGAGFASLTHVLSIRPDLVKLDLSLTRGIDQDHARCAIVRAIVEVAERIGATVVAEGVETRDELDTVAALGVTHAQGYLLARPEPLPLPSTVVEARPERRSHLRAESDATAGARFDLALRHSPIGMALVGLDGRFVHVNPALAAMLGYTEDQLVVRTFQELTHHDDLDEDIHLLQECLAGERDSYRIDKRYLTSDGAIVWGDLSVVVVRNDAGEPLYFVSQIQDVTERRQREQALVRRAATDSLTGLANRSVAIDRIEHLLEEDREFGVVFFDMDGFKAVNDDFGHDAGDQVLATVAERIRAAVRDTDVVARWGGDEFVAVLTVDRRTLPKAAERIRSSVALPMTIQPTEHLHTPTLSVGSTHRSVGVATTPTELIRRADHAMYDGRRSRR